MDLIKALFASQDLFRSLLVQVKTDQWNNPTPCTEWSVHDLVNHLTYEDLWLPDLCAGKTIAEVGNKYDGNVLGDNPLQSWDDAAGKARQALSQPNVLTKTVHLSYGDSKGESYLMSMLGDHVIHSWDLAKGIGADYSPDPKLLQMVWDWMSPRADQISGSSVFGPRVEVPENASLGEKLMALAGRDWNWQT